MQIVRNQERSHQSANRKEPDEHTEQTAEALAETDRSVWSNYCLGDEPESFQTGRLGLETYLNREALDDSGRGLRWRWNHSQTRGNCHGRPGLWRGFLKGERHRISENQPAADQAGPRRNPLWVCVLFALPRAHV